MIPGVGTNTPSRTLKGEKTTPSAVPARANTRPYAYLFSRDRPVRPHHVGGGNLLGKRIQAGDAEARQEMILANLRFAVKIALDYEGLGLPLLYLINEGNIGLMKAVERFAPAKGAKLSTYSSLVD